MVSVCCPSVGGQLIGGVGDPLILTGQPGSTTGPRVRMDNFRQHAGSRKDGSFIRSPVSNTAPAGTPAPFNISIAVRLVLAQHPGTNDLIDLFLALEAASGVTNLMSSSRSIARSSSQGAPWRLPVSSSRAV